MREGKVIDFVCRYVRGDGAEESIHNESKKVLYALLFLNHEIKIT
jgi:hypothetical protein